MDEEGAVGSRCLVLPRLKSQGLEFTAGSEAFKNPRHFFLAASET